MSHNQKVGRWGEQQAMEYLSQRGYQMLGRNVRTPYGEIDLLVEKAGVVVFVEVKTRLSGTVGRPEVSVTPRKQQHMAACAEYYAQQHGIDHWQIDVVAIQRLASKAEIKHFENAIS